MFRFCGDWHYRPIKCSLFVKIFPSRRSNSLQPSSCNITILCKKKRFKTWNIKILATSFCWEKERNVGCGKRMRKEGIKKGEKLFTGILNIRILNVTNSLQTCWRFSHKLTNACISVIGSKLSLESCKKKQLMHNLFLVYFVNLYMFRAYLGPSSGGTTVCIQQLVLIILIRWLPFVLVGLAIQPGQPTVA